MQTLIVGAGIAGLSMALRLRQLGLLATVVEAAPAPHRHLLPSAVRHPWR